MRLLALLLLLAPAVATAQGVGTLIGRVTDERGEGLPGTSVTLDGTPLGAATNRDGYYRLLGVPAGTYSVTHWFVGLLPGRTTEVYVGSRETVVLDATLIDAVCCLGCEVETWEPPLAFANPDPYAFRRVRVGDPALLAYR